MPTIRGWLVTAAGLSLWSASRAFGVPALGQLGFGLIALVVIAVFVVRMGRHDVGVRRTVTPERAQAGREVTVDLHLINSGRGAAPLLLLEDQLPTELSARARFAVRGIEPKGNRVTSYTLRPARRGHYAIGPLEVTVMDPFGVARKDAEAAGLTTFLVYPRTEPLSLPKDSGNRRTVTVSARRQPTGSTGEDFYTLREYVEGDDLKRIHWPATAKRGRYMIRQEETPWHARATVLLDDRAEAYNTHSWERGVEVAASMIDLYHRAGYAFRLVRSIGSSISSSRGTDHFHRCLDLLAIAEDLPRPPEAEADPLLLRLSELETQPSVEGVLICVTSTPTLDAARALTRLSRRYKMVVAVVLPAERYGVAGRTRPPTDPVEVTTALLQRGGLHALTLNPGDRLTSSWSALWKVWGPSATLREDVSSGI
jgi:uncharacterized protein (DUF58 family)